VGGGRLRSLRPFNGGFPEVLPYTYIELPLMQNAPGLLHNAPHTTNTRQSFQCVTLDLHWHAPCQDRFMLINTTILRDISFQVTSGNAAYGLLLANEYLPPSDPLRKALARRAGARFPSSCGKAGRHIVQGLMAGLRAEELPEGWKDTVGKKSIRDENCRPIPLNNPWIPNTYAPARKPVRAPQRVRRVGEAG
jgi:hypothetical protein